MHMELLAGKKSEALDSAAFTQRLAGFEQVWIDLGCGDGLFAYRRANSHPDVLVIGIDAARENLRATASKARRSVKKGGLENLLFIVAGVENLPDELSGLAAELTVNFPWGSLLRGILEGSGPVLGGVARLARPGGHVEMLLNDSLYRDDPLLKRLDLPKLDAAHIESVMLSAFADHGLTQVNATLVPNRYLPHRTSWGQRLADSHPDGSTWHLEAIRTSRSR
jgi:16S rRNA (adenine(1408)-N(1))-methyltransferase